MILSLALLAMYIAGAPHALSQELPRPTRVLLIYAPAPDSPTADNFVQAFRGTVRKELAPEKSVEFYEEYLDLDRFPGLERWPQLARYFADKYKGFRLDVVVPVGSVALRFTAEHLRAFAPGAPVVFAMTFAHRVDVSTLPRNFTGRLIPMPLGATVAMARRLQPDAERVVVIAGASAVDSLAMEGALRDFARQRNGIPLELRQGLPYKTLLTDLRRLSTRAIVFFAHFRRDGDGNLFVPVNVIHDIVRESRAPVYSYVDKLLGSGIVGGALVRHDDEAANTARLAVRVLRGGSAERLPPVEIANTPYMADWRQLRRWGLDERRLPARTEILFREPTVWERFRAQILSALGIFAAQSLLIVLLLVERRGRLRAQRELEAQRAYECLIAELTTDAGRHAPDESPHALDDALARIGRFARASAATLVEEDDAHQRSVRQAWTADGNGANSRDPAAPRAITGAEGARLAIPLVGDNGRIGTLELHRDEDGAWPPDLLRQLGVAAELIAGAMARGRDRRLAELRAEETRRQIAHLGRVAMIGELTAAVAHDLHQPLTAIRINAETGITFLANDPPELDEVRAILRDIVRDVVRGADVIDRIRVMLRKEEPKRVAVDLNEICHQAVHVLQRDAAIRATRLVLTPSDEPALVSGDSILLQQVVLNLILNALDAAAASDGDRRVVVATAVRDGHVEITVRDTGRGLTPEVQQHLFDAFFTTKTHGLGMGLAIVRSIVERHDGRISAENAPSSGAVFRVRLPIAPPSVETPRTLGWNGSAETRSGRHEAIQALNNGSADT